MLYVIHEIRVINHHSQILVRFLSDSCQIPIRFPSDSRQIPIRFPSDSHQIPVRFPSLYFSKTYLLKCSFYHLVVLCQLFLNLKILKVGLSEKLMSVWKKNSDRENIFQLLVTNIAKMMKNHFCMYLCSK